MGMSGLSDQIANQYQIKNLNTSLLATNLDLKVNEEILWELFLQTGPLRSIFLPRDPLSDRHFGYAFIEYESELDANYTLKILSPLRLFNKLISINKLSHDGAYSIGACLYIGNINNNTDEQLIYSTFSSFGNIIKAPFLSKTFTNKGVKYYALVTYDSYDSADSAIYNMNGQMFNGNVIIVDYFYSTSSVKNKTSVVERMINENRKLFHH